MSLVVIPNKGRSTARVAPNQSNSNTKTSRRKRKAKQQINPRVRESVLKPCSVAYFDALVDPFSASERHLPPCLPDLYDSMSFKFTSRARGYIDIGTNGYGMIGVTPYFPLSNGTYVAGCSGYVTNTAFIGSTFPTFGTSASELRTLVVANSPYSTIAGVNYRPVGLGVRVRYIGTELNRGGFILPIFVADAAGLAGLSTTQILNNNNSQTFQVDRKWHGSFWRPTDSTHYEYRQTTTSVANVCPLGIAVSGVAGLAAQYEYEVVWYYEVRPTPTIPLANLSKSEADIVGLSNIRDYIGTLTNSVAGKAIYDRGITYMKMAAVKAVSGVMGGGLTIEL